MKISRTLARSMTGISWADFTANQWVGCTRIKAVKGAKSGCDICYAATFAENRMGVTWGAGEDRRLVKNFRDKLRHLNRVAEKTGLSFSVFSESLSDPFDSEVPQDFRSSYFDGLEETPHLTHVVLTHRPHNIVKFAPGHWMTELPANIWVGTTLDHYLHAFRWNKLQEVLGYSGRTWVSAEPLASSLMSLDLADAATIIVGGASNTKDPDWAFDVEWARELIGKYGDKVFFKQHGVFREGNYVGTKKAGGADVDGEYHLRTPWPLHRNILLKAAV